MLYIPCSFSFQIKKSYFLLHAWLPMLKFKKLNELDTSIAITTKKVRLFYLLPVLIRKVICLVFPPLQYNTKKFNSYMF